MLSGGEISAIRLRLPKAGRFPETGSSAVLCRGLFLPVGKRKSQPAEAAGALFRFGRAKPS